MPQNILSKKFNQNLFFLILISSVLSNFSFVFYINVLNPNLLNDSVAKNEAYQNWLSGMNVFNIILIILVIWIGLVYIATGFKGKKLTEKSVN